MRFLILLLCFVLLSNPVLVSAEIPTEDMPELYVRTVKTKGDDFIYLTATTDIQLNNYWMGYDSALPLVELTPEYPLPSGVLHKGQTILLNGESATPTCDAVLAAEMPISLADSKGAVAFWKMTRLAGSSDLDYEYVDGFTWSTSTKSVADLLFTDTTVAEPVGHRLISETNLTWKTGVLEENEFGDCVVREKNGQVVASLPVTPTDEPGFVQEETMNEPVVAEDADIVDVNEGLLAPIISELLPNPAGTGNDDTDEFIEIYNPNDSTYNLSGFVLQTGVSTLYTYTIPEGVEIAPKSYEVFSSEQTGLTLSNTKSQAILKNNIVEVISQTEVYTSAIDGRSWILKDDGWVWSTTSTPASENILTQPVSIVAATAKKAVKAASTTAKKTTATKKTTKTAAKSAKPTEKTTKTLQPGNTAFAESSPPIRSIHPLVLALVALTAVGYGLYEYRHDMANRYYKFRTNRAARRANRS